MHHGSLGSGIQDSNVALVVYFDFLMLLVLLEVMLCSCSLADLNSLVDFNVVQSEKCCVFDVVQKSKSFPVLWVVVELQFECLSVQTVNFTDHISNSIVLREIMLSIILVSHDNWWDDNLTGRIRYRLGPT